MGPKAPVPPFSALAQKAFDDLGKLEFTGSGVPKSRDALIALCAMFDLEYSAEDHLIPNTSLTSGGQEAQVRIYVQAMNELKEHLRKREPFDIHTQRMRHVASQGEARDIALGALAVLNDEVQNAQLGEQKVYKAAYDSAQRVFDESRQEWYR